MMGNKHLSIFDSHEIVPYRYLISSREEYIVIWEPDNSNGESLDACFKLVLTEIEIFEGVPLDRFVIIRYNKHKKWAFAKHKGNSFDFIKFWDDKHQDHVTFSELFSLLNNIDEIRIEALSGR